MTEKIVHLLQNWQRLTRAVEGLLIDNVSASVPWLAPLPAAFMMYHAMQTALGFPVWVAIAGAVVVEALGLSAVSTCFALWDFNDTRRQKDQTAPVKIALVVAGYYLLIVLIVNVLLDGTPLVYKLAKALLSTLSVVAAVILALRSQHTRRLATIDQERQERREERLKRLGLAELGNGNGRIGIHEVKYPKGSLDWRSLSITDRERVKTLSTREIVEVYGIPGRTARNWRVLAGKNGHKAQVFEP